MRTANTARAAPITEIKIKAIRFDVLKIDWASSNRNFAPYYRIREMYQKGIAIILISCLLLQMDCAGSMKKVPVEQGDYSSLENELTIFVTLKDNQTFRVRDFTITETQIRGTVITYPRFKWNWGDNILNRFLLKPDTAKKNGIMSGGNNEKRYSSIRSNLYLVAGLHIDSQRFR
jgi:hypothetical protein